MKDIIERYKKFIEGHDEGWVYDETYEFFNDLTRGELCRIMDYLIKTEDKREFKKWIEDNSSPHDGDGYLISASSLEKI